VHKSGTIAEPVVRFLAPGGLRIQNPIKLRKVVDRRNLATPATATLS